MARSRGFTLIEMLMVVVIVGILVTIMVPRFANTKEKALGATMKSDLKNLASAEEAYYYDYSSYTAVLAGMPMYQPSVGVTVTINEAGVSGWSATAASSAAVRKCYLFVGSAAPVGAATQEGQVACSQVIWREFPRRRDGLAHALDGGLWLHRFILDQRPMAHLVSSDREQLEAWGRSVGLDPRWLQYKPLRDPRTGVRVPAWHWDLWGDLLPPR